jgi:hypothetical protein
MNQSLFIKNIPIDEKRISFLETVVSRLARRSKKHTSAIITPYPISNCVSGDDVRGPVLKYMFCATGIISKGLVFLKDKPETGVMLTITIENDVGGSTKSYVITKKSSIVEPNIEVFSGDRLTISINPVGVERDKVSEIWISFMWTPTIKDVDVKNFLINSLDGDLDVFEE